MNKKIRICFPFVGNSIGGSHLSTIELIKKLNKEKFETILLLHKKGILHKHLIEEDLKIEYLKKNNFVGQKKGILINLIYIIRSLFNLTPYINKKKIDIVHLNDSSAGLSWILATKLSRAKLIWHQRIVFPQWPLYKFLSFFPEKIISISNFVNNSLPKLNFQKSVKIFNPITINKIKEKKKLLNKYFRNKKEKKVLFLANIIESKRVEVFINISKSISETLPNSKFFIVGSDKKKILKKYSTNLEDGIIYLGYSKNKEFWLKNCNLLLVTAENEGFNRSIVEAMLSKIPVIAVNSGAHNEIIKNNYNGWLTNINDLNNLKKTVIKVLSLKKTQLKKIVDNANKTAKKEFNINNHVRKISKVYIDTMS